MSRDHASRPQAARTGETLALVAVQLALSTDDFASERAYREAIERAAARAATRCVGADHRLLVFPEDVGHFIPLIHAPRSARRQKTVQRAMAVLAARRPLRLARAMWSGATWDPERGMMLAVMPAADRLMRDLFAGIARRHQAHVVAGSHLLASGDVVTNSSYTFDPMGRIVAATHKVNLVPNIEDDRPGGAKLASGHARGLPVVHTPFGALATLICYDGFHVPHTRTEPRFVFMGERADALGAQVLANPAANPWPWNGPWVHAQPDTEMSRREQWRREGLAGSMERLSSNVAYGVTAHFCARILDFDFHGRSEILANTDRGVEVLAEAESHDRDEIVAVHVPAPRVRQSVTPRTTQSRGTQPGDASHLTNARGGPIEFS